tara:strand:+ start:7000 stop:8625 length:1626 start_codon:yes stop_codon:yes gene_type:complete
MLFEPSDRNYSEPITISSRVISPIKERLLVGDTINETSISHTSKYRTETSIPGILVYNGQSFGRHKDKMLYKCIPNDKKLPIFLIPYSDKKSNFNKVKLNKYILFKFVEWKDKHPLAMITNTLGDVNNTYVYYDYQLYCKNIHYSIQKLTKCTNKELLPYKKKEIFNDEIKSRNDVEIITIDPEGSIDFDDALSIDTTSNTTIITVYISNVPFVLDKLNLWDELSNRVSTIYLPHEKKPMLPPALSDNICSLIEKKIRSVVAMDIHITSDGEIIDINYSNCFVKVDKNYVYEDKDLINNINYKLLLDYAIKINNNKKYLDNIDDSHDVVALYMILMNHEVGKYLSSHNSGIYRDVKYVDANLESINVSNTLRKFLNIYNNVEANYKLYELDIEHQLIGKGVDYYTQVTSPIRRIVDLINIILLQKYDGLIETNDSINNFIDKWLKSIQTINNDMKSIRKVQNDCNLLNECIVNNKQQSYEGYIIKFDKNYDNYSVYLPSIKLLTYVKSNDKLEIYKKYSFTIHVFNDEYTLKQKVRLQMIY